MSKKNPVWPTFESEQRHSFTGVLSLNRERMCATSFPVRHVCTPCIRSTNVAAVINTTQKSTNEQIQRVTELNSLNVPCAVIVDDVDTIYTGLELLN